jgi:hypothetical protein
MGAMSEATRRGIGILAGALALGALGDALFRVWPWGLNLTLWVVALVVVAVALSRLTADRAAASPADRILIIPVLFFAAAVAWRDSTVLLWLNLLALGVSLSLIALYSTSQRLVAASLMDYALGTMMVWLSTSIGPLILAANDVHWSEIRGTGRFAQAPAVLRGVVLAVPPILVFGALFVSADAAFDRLVRNVIRIDLDEMIVHGTVIIAIAWFVAGWARHMLLEQSWDNPASRTDAPFGFGMVETGIVLGAVDLLFLVFVVIQLGYLFGGATFVEASREFTYSEYARRGFFELVWVAGLSLSFLLVARWVARPTSARGEHVFVTLAIVFIGLLYVIMISALSRMALYTSLFGLTELRLYPTAFMGWLAVVFAWFVATALRGKGQHFAIGALVAGFITIGVLNAINPDGLIVRTNFGRVGAPRPLDTQYLSSLSADAVPALVEGLPTLPAPEQQLLRTMMATRWPATVSDWRTWNWSRSRAAAARAAEPARDATYRQENS